MVCLRHLLFIVATVLCAPAQANARADSQLPRWQIEPTTLPGACGIAQPRRLWIRGADIDSAGRAYLLATEGIIALAPNGHERWRFLPCPGPGNLALVSSFQTFALDGTGGAWLVEQQSNAVFEPFFTRLLHVDANGAVVAAASLSELLRYDSNVRVLATPAGATLLATALNATSITVARFTHAGVLLDVHMLALPAAGFSQRAAVQPDERTLLAWLDFYGNGEEPLRSHLARIDLAHGTLHVFDAPLAAGRRALGQDGTLWQVDASGNLASIDAAGTTTHVVLTPALAQPPLGMSAPMPDVFFIRGASSIHRVSTQGAVDVVADLPGDTILGALQTTATGVLAPLAFDGAESARWFDAATLTPGVRFVFPATADSATRVAWLWRVSADGHVVGVDSASNPFGTPSESRVGGFVVPGSLAARRVYGDGFEP